MKNYIIPNTEVLTLQSLLMQAQNVSGGDIKGVKTGEMPESIN